MAMGRTGFPQKEMDTLQPPAPQLRAHGRVDPDSGGPWLLGKDITLADVR